MLISSELTYALLWLANCGLLVVFAMAGSTKLRDAAQTRAALTNFGVPERWAQPLFIMLVLAEFGVTALLVYPPTQRAGAVCALGLLMAFTLAMAAQLLRGRRPACACFGALSQSPIGWRSVARNVLLMALAGGLVALPTANNVLLPILPLLVAMAWAALSAIWLLHLTRQNGRLLLRIEQLEHSAVEPTSPQPAAQPQPLQLGSPLPPLRLNDAHGRPFELRRFRGMPIQFLFLDADCTHCRTLITYLHEIPLANINTALIVISKTDVLRHQLPAEVTLLVDPGWSTMTLFGLRGTPAAVSVDADGALAQLAVHGTSAVRAAIAAMARSAPEQSSGQSAPSHDHEEVQHELATV